MANAICAELTADDWQTLYLWFRINKLEIISKTEIEKFDTALLPDAPDGRMVGFVDVFPWGQVLDFPVRDEFWGVDEQYCVRPNCDCRETMLTFLKYRDATIREIVGRRRPPVLRYNYRTGTVKELERWPETLPSPKEMMEALKKSEPTLNTGLELRHTLLQALYMQRELNRTVAALRLPTRSSKVGRNDPCRCGSGKKFKQCCLGKSA